MTNPQINKPEENEVAELSFRAFATGMMGQEYEKMNHGDQVMFNVIVSTARHFYTSAKDNRVNSGTEITVKDFEHVIVTNKLHSEQAAQACYDLAQKMKEDNRGGEIDWDAIEEEFREWHDGRIRKVGDIFSWFRNRPELGQKGEGNYSDLKEEYDAACKEIINLAYQLKDAEKEISQLNNELRER